MLFNLRRFERTAIIQGVGNALEGLHAVSFGCTLDDHIHTLNLICVT